MKYMGSKRAMLGNGLGLLLEQEMDGAKSFVDLFTGSAAVAIHVAKNFDVPVRAYDLQEYSSVLANAILARDSSIDWESLYKEWLLRSTDVVSMYFPPKVVGFTPLAIARHRGWCSRQHELVITRAYGGHYFSPEQAVWIDALRISLPVDEPSRTVALAALIQVASQCAAAPGHTAQPFQPTETASKYIADAWRHNIPHRVKANLAVIATQFGRQLGIAVVQDANSAAAQLEEGEVAFIDPPYSGVHYSRFYHVLETVASGFCGDVEGRGRYPAPQLRPRSKYSLGSQSAQALTDLFTTIANRGARAIVTFPDHVCSNGLSGEIVRELASQHFSIREQYVQSKFSTLGGTGQGREARQQAKELILILSPD